MTTPTHITNLIPDYMLGLLSPHVTRQVENHIHTCPVCRAALAEERQIGLAVRQTLAIVTRPEPGRLARLRPEPPRKSRFRSGASGSVAASGSIAAFWQGGQRLAAAALLIFLIIAGAWFLYPGGGGPENNPQQAVTAIAVTATREPTSTTSPVTPDDATSDEPETGPSPTYEVFLPPLETSEAKTSLSKMPSLHTPPAGTPIAALPAANQP